MAAARLQHPAAPASSIARESVARYGGELPSDEETLLSFKGIGAYTAGAIRSFAFGQRAAILDTNVARVLFRVFVGRGDVKAHAMRKRLWAMSEVLVPRKQVFDFNQALMDFGATVCVARKPKCDVCPMTKLCTSYPDPVIDSGGLTVFHRNRLLWLELGATSGVVDLVRWLTRAALTW